MVIVKDRKEPVERTTICVINQKGGAGKSTSCFHLSGAFAQLGHNVLVIDADPQGSISQGFFGSAHVESLAPQQTLAALFDEDRYLAGPELLIHRTPVERVWLVPANDSLSVHNCPAPATAGLKQFVLREFVRGLVEFDLVLIDCPPNLYQCSWNGLLAADAVMIPVPPEDFGTQGLRVVHQAITEAQTLNPVLAVLGHLISRYDRRLLVHRTYADKLRQLYGPSVLATVIPEAVAFKMAVTCRQPVTLSHPRSTAAGLTSLLAREILARTEGKSAQRHLGKSAPRHVA